jgi:hypothetical protein
MILKVFMVVPFLLRQICLPFVRPMRAFIPLRVRLDF